jgi:hypothetical protein
MTGVACAAATRPRPSDRAWAGRTIASGALAAENRGRHRDAVKRHVESKLVASPAVPDHDAAPSRWIEAATTAIMEVVLRRVSSATFVGRTAELAVLDAALDGSAAGVPAFAFVAGESGVGKSRLVGEFEARAIAGGARVLVGRCMELGGAVFPYAPLVDALRPVARDFVEGLAPELPAGSRAALAELIP